MLAPLTWLTGMLRPRLEKPSLTRRQYERMLREAGLSRQDAKIAAARRFFDTGKNP